MIEARSVGGLISAPLEFNNTFHYRYSLTVERRSQNRWWGFDFYPCLIDNGGSGEVVNTSVCGTDMRGFDSHHRP